jgi:predicted ATP-dependent protease
MTAPAPLTADRLRRSTDPSSLGFASTAELDELGEIVWQDRAVEAVTFALDMRREGYNVYALGPEGTGKHTVIRQFLETRAATEPDPDDWCYVHNFVDSQRPRALRLPAGRGAVLRDQMDRLAIELRSAIRTAFEGDQYRVRKDALEDEVRKRRDATLDEFEARAKKVEVALIRMPMGLALAPMHQGEAIDSDRFHKLPEADQARIRAAMEALETELAAALRQVPRWEREAREKLRELNQRVTKDAVGHLFEEVRAEHAGELAVLEFLADVEEDVVAHAVDFLASAEKAEAEPLPVPIRGLISEAAPFRRYAVNLLVDNSRTKGAPVVYEDNPTYANLVGRVEQVAQLGALLTDFTLVRPGALHRANGGYLVLDVRETLRQPLAWDALKRAIRGREIRIESLAQSLSLATTVGLEPEPIPFDAKVALVGDRMLYYLLCELDPDFLELFKVQADFEEEIDRTAEAAGLYGRLMGTIARREGLRPLSAGAVAAVLDFAVRQAGDAEKVSTHMRSITDLMREADHHADVNEHAELTAADVERAIAGKHRRAGRIRELIHEAIRRGSIIVETSGESVGQVNGLSVGQTGEVTFGWPVRITARARLGRGELIDIEREVDLGGPIHSKGVMILAGFLGGRYAERRPLPVHASLVFEQSYAGIEGDSASVAELCALLSAIGEVPIRQSIAVTGSVDQHGRVQAVGGLNEKIEGFYDVCAARGLTGEQGVVIPSANVRNLMLRQDVVDAARAGRFHVWPVQTVDEAAELLTGRPAGERDEDGAYPADSVNGRVEARIAELAELARQETAAASDATADEDEEPGSGSTTIL